MSFGFFYCHDHDSREERTKLNFIYWLAEEALTVMKWACMRTRASRVHKMSLFNEIYAH